MSYLTAERDIVLIEPLSLSKHSQQHHETPLPYVHVFEECPAVKRAIARDGEVLRSRAPVDAFLSPPAARPCGVCLRWWRARG